MSEFEENVQMEIEEKLSLETSVQQEIQEEVKQEKQIPKLVFIVPYRDRQLQLNFFNRHMSYVLEDMPKEDYKILIVHQKDHRSFNRGALKNIGFLIVRDLYPKHYKDITFVFNDLDTMPYVKNYLDYNTKRNVVKHFYGVPFTLGGIFSIKGVDFEKINGFPNFWAWGYEDNLIHSRAKNAKLIIDRSQFYPMHDSHIIHLSDGSKREVNKGEFDRYVRNTREGWTSIKQLQYEFEEDSHLVHIYNFDTGIEENLGTRKIHDLKNGTTPFHGIRSQRNATMNLNMGR